MRKSKSAHVGCSEEIRSRMAAMGVEVVVSEARPLVANPYIDAMICPHGRTLYYEPTSDQIAVWARDGVR